MAARTGNEMSGPALLLMGLAMTGSPVVASWLMAGLTASAAVGGPLLGALLDRAERPGRIVGRCLLGYTAGLLAVLLGLGRVPDAALVAVAAVAGLLGPALTGGWTAQLPLVVPPERLERANALDAISYNVAGLAGPAAVGLVAAAASGQAAMAVSVALLVAAVPVAWTLPSRSRPTASVRAGRAALWRDLAAGFGAIARNAPLRRATATSMVSFSGVAMLVVGAPMLGSALTGEASHGALLLAVTAGSALAANAALTRLRGWTTSPDALLVGSTLVLGAAMLVAAAAYATGLPGLAVLAAVLAGVAEGPQLTALLAVRHREAPPHLRGQIFTTGASLKITSYAVGSALAGPLAAYDVGVALLAGAALQALAGVAYGLLSRP
ncbi:MFS transporter [Nocardia aurea]|uniref:MFS transporter n=1 Tax=Nocardia aurea TaxID=2144174 RepID=UPI0018E4E5FF|nr:MFS transporter [Nocardia aurea]